MDRGNYEGAAKLFDEVERQHPYSVWARRAQLMSAFSYYLAQKYTDAISSANRFVTIHPGNADAPYAHYLIAMSYYQQVADVQRDQAITQQASQAFGELIRRYPESRYAADARLKLDLINDHLAGKEMEVGRFYQRSGNWLAASLRFREVVEKYQTTSHAPEALERLVESYLALGVPEEARKTAAVLGKNYPDSYWYRQSLRLLLKHYPGATAARTQAAAQAPTQGHRAGRPAQARVRAGPRSADRRDRRGQVDPARCARAGARLARGRRAGAERGGQCRRIGRAGAAARPQRARSA
jgi:outer membrane protein assembly factor BamD